MKMIKMSLKQLLGKDYMEAVVSGADLLYGLKTEDASRLAEEEVDFIPEAYIKKMDSLLERLEIHRQYWNGEDMKRIPVSFRLGDYFFADKFKAALPLLKPGLKIEPSMLEVDAFLEDYERIFNEIEAIGQDGFWTAEPYSAIPWMEAILGCPVFAVDRSFITEPCINGEIGALNESAPESNAWYCKYMEFTRKLVQLSGSRFPVGQPIMRGPSDVAGALLGQTRFIHEMNDNPEAVNELVKTIVRIFLKIVGNQFELIPDFYGGTSIGFYHVWTPGKCIWFQEDLTALLSPGWYKDFIKECDRKICHDFSYNAIHVHPSSFHILNEILSIDRLKAVEINKDVGEPSVTEMMPVFKKVLKSGKRMIIWGDLDGNDIQSIRQELPPVGVFLNIVAENAAKASRLLSLVR